MVTPNPGGHQWYSTAFKGGFETRLDEDTQHVGSFFYMYLLINGLRF